MGVVAGTVQLSRQCVRRCGSHKEIACDDKKCQNKSSESNGHTTHPHGLARTCLHAHSLLTVEWQPWTAACMRTGSGQTVGMYCVTIAFRRFIFTLRILEVNLTKDSFFCRCSLSLSCSNLVVCHIGALKAGGVLPSHTIPIPPCATQQGCDFEAPDLERDIHFRDVSWNRV